MAESRDYLKKMCVVGEASVGKTSLIRRFVVDKFDDKYLITIGYSWSEERSFGDPKLFPEEPGVYRLKKEGEIVRIGEGGNMRDRLNIHLKDYPSDVDMFDFEIVPDAEERKKEEKRLIKSFQQLVGRLPKLNPIAK